MALTGDAAARAAATVMTPAGIGDWLVVLPVVLPLAIGALLVAMRQTVRLQFPVAIAGVAATLVINGALLFRVVADGPIAVTIGSWRPPFGITFAADVLGAAFATTAAFVTFAGTVFSYGDIGVAGRRYGFYPFLMLLTAGVNGAFLTGDIFNLYVWFEVFVIASFGLLVLGSKPSQLDGAIKYAVLNLIATTALLIAVALLYGALGTLNMADLIGTISNANADAPMMTIATLFLFAFAMKAAAFPLNFWLPASYHTPQTTVAALFGGMLTKIGIYCLIRVLGMILPEQLGQLSGLLGWLAIATMLIGALGALGQADIRRTVGFLVVGGVGVMLAGIAIGTTAGMTGSILYGMHSMLTMTALYLLVGVIGERSGSFSLEGLGGLYERAPGLAAVAMMLFLSVSGLPLGAGLWPKIMITKSAIDTGSFTTAAAILFNGLLTTIAVFRIFSLAFWRRGTVPDRASSILPAASSIGMILPIVMLAAIVLTLAVYPEPFIDIANFAARGVADPSGYINAVIAKGEGR